MGTRADGARVVRVGHRGAAALAPENSLESLALAVELGVDVVEFDVVRRADGSLALGHGARSLGDGSPSLDEALELLAPRDVGIHLDLKAAGEARRAAAALRRHGLVRRSLLASTSLRALRDLAAAAPDLRRAVSYPDDRLGIAGLPGTAPLIRVGTGALRAALPRRVGRWVRLTRPAVLSVHWGVSSAALAARCRSLGVALYAWTVNERPLAERLVAAGLDGIITDDPRILRGFPGE